MIAPGFVRLWVATTASGLATWALPFVLALSVVAGDLRAGTLGWALALRTTGFLVSLPAAGVLADRVSRRLVVGVAGVLGAVAVCVVAAGSASSTLVLLIGTTTAGVAEGACRPAFQAMVAEVVPAERRQSANAALTLSVRGCVLAGPVLASTLAAAVGPRGVLGVVVGLWLVAAILPARGPLVVEPAGAGDAAPGLVRGFAEGLAEARRHPWFLAGLGALASVILTGYSVTAIVLPLVSSERYDNESLLAAGLTAYTLGAIVGALVMSRWRPGAQGWAALAGLGVYALVPLSLALDAPAAVVVVAYVGAGLGIELFNVPWFTATQREVPADRLSRVSSLDFLISYGLAPVGLALVVPAIDLVGQRTTLLVCAGICLCGPALAATVRSSRAFSTPAPSGSVRTGAARA